MPQLRLPTKSTYFSSNDFSNLELQNLIKARASFVGGLIGCSVFSPNYSVVNVPLVLVLSNLFGFYFLSFYDIYIFRNDLVRCCFCLVTLFIGFQGIFKIYTFLFYRWKVLELKSRAEKFLTNFNTDKTTAVFEYWLIWSCHIGVALIILFLMGSFVVLSTCF